MGESSACLMRSFSVPSPTSSDEKKGNPLQRALTSSISFGRFMSESLDWEKWSAFNHNRYLEEVERYSKPGSVAAKKAYFEAHYKRRRAEKLLEQENAAASAISETNETHDKVEDSSFVNPELAEEANDGEDQNSGMVLAVEKAYSEAHYKRDRAEKLLDQQNAAASTLSETNATNKVEDSSFVNPKLAEETHDGEVQNQGTVLAVNQDSVKDRAIGRTLEEKRLSGIKEVAEPFVLEENQVELANHLENDGCIGEPTVCEDEVKICDDDDTSVRNPQSSSAEKPEVSLSEILTNGSTSMNLPPAKPVEISDKRTPNSKIKSRDPSNKRRSTSTTLHLSIPFAPGFSDAKKPASPILPKIANSRLFNRPPPKKFINSTMTQTSTRASVSVTFKHHLMIPPPENRRTKTLHGESISRNKIFDGKVPSPSRNHSQSSNDFGSKATRSSSTVSAPFTFKSEERAAKRKEFFQKLQQKWKSMESVKDDPREKSQGKAKGDLKNLRNSISVEATKNAEVPPITELSSNLTKKIPRVKPYTPKVQESVVFKAQNNDPRPPWRFSLKTETLKDATGKKIRGQVSSATSSKKSMRENDCPNIQV